MGYTFILGLSWSEAKENKDIAMFPKTYLKRVFCGWFSASFLHGKVDFTCYKSHKTQQKVSEGSAVCVKPDRQRPGHQVRTGHGYYLSMLCIFMSFPPLDLFLDYCSVDVEPLRAM